MGDSIFNIFMILFIVLGIPFLLGFCYGLVRHGIDVLSRKRNERISAKIVQKREKENYRIEEEKKREQDKLKRLEQEKDKKYNRIINCPGCEGHGEAYLHAVFWKEQYELSVNFTEKEYLDKDGNYHGPTWKEYMATDYFSRATCPDCNGEGIAYAWFEKVAPQSVSCHDCQGTGKHTIKVKVEIGTEERQTSCRKCNGEGRSLIKGKEVVHVKTTHSSKTVSCHMTGSFFEHKEYIQKTPRCFDIDITDENRNFFSKSKPRFS